MATRLGVTDPISLAKPSPRDFQLTEGMEKVRIKESKEGKGTRKELRTDGRSVELDNEKAEGACSNRKEEKRQGSGKRSRRTLKVE